MTHKTHYVSGSVRLFAVLCGVPLMLAAQGGFNGAGRYEIRNLKSGKVLDLDRNDQTTVIQFSSRNTDNQSWELQPAGSGYFYIRNMMNGYALEAGGNNNSAPLRGVPFNGSANQQWMIESGKDGNALIVNRNGRAIDVPDGTDRDGTRMQIYDRNGDSNQRFILRAVSGGSNRGWRNAGGNQNWQNRPGTNLPAGGTALTCSSNDGSRVYCDTNTSGGVQLTRQISGSPCRQGETWGYDNRGVWVDRGCRAEFQVGAPGNSNWNRGMMRGRNMNREVINCSSRGGRRSYCGSNVTGAQVRLLRESGNQRCIQGQTWGTDNRGIWVERGCSAQFEVQR